VTQIPILLLEPKGGQPSSTDQAEAATVAALLGPENKNIALEREHFSPGEAGSIEKAVDRCAGRVLGVVGATGVAESKRLGELAHERRLLCFVANNNPVVWEHRDHIFHIGVPTDSLASAIAEGMVGTIGAKRIFILRDIVEFQAKLARSVERWLRRNGHEVQTQSGHEENVPSSVKQFEPDAIFFACTDAELVLPWVCELRRALPKVHLLLGMSQLRSSFPAQVADERVLFVDLFCRSRPERQAEKTFMATLTTAGKAIPTPNHGFGWDAMSLCSGALIAAKGDVTATIKNLESGARYEGATGYFEFSCENHNGRETFNPVVISQIKKGRVLTYGKD
jgi:ABC-type branched-subunit amino acid transport system substrate-binding protein